MTKDKNWQPCPLQIFWGDVAAGAHVMQIYEQEEVLLNLLEGFVAGGISVGDCVILIATPAHLDAIAHRLRVYGLNPEALEASSQYLPLNAEAVLSKFMVDGRPDYHLFMATIDAVFERAHQVQRPVRAFGEMVALLWAEGNMAATVMLEHLWNSYAEKEQFTLFCAYPQGDFSPDDETALSHICKAHTKIVTTWKASRTELAYTDAGA